MTRSSEQNTISNSLILSTVLIVFFAGITGIGWLSLSRIDFRTRYNTQLSLQTVLRTTQEAIYIWFENRRRMIEDVAEMPEFVSMTRTLLSLPRNRGTLLGSSVQEKVRAFFKPRLDEYDDLGIFIISPDLINIASMRDANVGLNSFIAEKRPNIIEKVFQGETRFIPTILSDVPLPDKFGRIAETGPTLFVSCPIKNKDAIIAILTIRIDPSKDFTRIIQLGRIGESGETYAIDDKGIMISGSRFDHQIRGVGLIKPDERSVLNLRVADPGLNLLSGSRPKQKKTEWPLTKMAAEATAGISGFDVRGYRDYRGVEVFGAWLWDDKLDLGLATEINSSEAMEPFYATRSIVLGLLVSSSILAIVLSTVIIVVQKRSEIQLRLAYNELDERVKMRTMDLENVRVELSIANRELQNLATTDSLTGLANRRSFDSFLKKEWKRCLRTKCVISLAMMDIDYFKIYNDTYGHQAGDECLKKIGLILKNHRFVSRPGDIIARYGGEEFVVVFAETDRSDALYILEKIAEAVRGAQILHEKSKLGHVTVSIGLASAVPEEDES